MNIRTKLFLSNCLTQWKYLFLLNRAMTEELVGCFSVGCQHRHLSWPPEQICLAFYGGFFSVCRLIAPLRGINKEMPLWDNDYNKLAGYRVSFDCWFLTGYKAVCLMNLLHTTCFGFTILFCTLSGTLVTYKEIFKNNLIWMHFQTKHTSPLKRDHKFAVLFLEIDL